MFERFAADKSKETRKIIYEAFGPSKYRRDVLPGYWLPHYEQIRKELYLAAGGLSRVHTKG